MKAKRMLAFVLAAAMVFGDMTPVLAAAPSEYTEQDVIPEGTEETAPEGQPSDTADPEQNGDSAAGKPEDGSLPSDSGNSDAGSGTSGTEPAPGESASDGSLKDPSTNPDGDVPEDKEDTEGEEAPGNPEDADGTESEAPVSEETISGEKESASGEEELAFEEVDASEYILQDGGNGILPEDENGGISVFSLNEERLMAAIAEGLRKRQASIDISEFGIDKDALKPFYIKVINNNPSLFYAKSAWSTSFIQSTNKAVSITPSYDERYDDNSSRQYEEAVQEALKAVNDQMDDLEKALALHDYLVQNCAYENDGGGNYKNYNAYNALVDGTCVCQGYTLAYTELLQQVGIPVSYATSDAMNHIWNMVELDNQWYHVDATWDDPIPDLAGRVGHKNFLRSDSGITATGHYSWETGVDGAKGTDDSYASGKFWNGLNTAVFYEGDVCYYLSDTGSITERSDDGSETVIYRMTDTRWPVWNGSGSWVGIFSGLSRSGDYLYCNDKLHVYRISLSSFTADSVYTYEGGDGYLYGSCAKNENLALAVAQSPNVSAKEPPTRLTVPIPPMEEVPAGPGNLNYTWNTIDGGTADSMCTETDRMKLIVFAPYWSYGRLDGFYRNPLLRDNKYLDVVVLDTMGTSADEIRRNITSDKKYPDAPITYCYYEDFSADGNPILNNYNEYRALADMGEHDQNVRQYEVTAFLINEKNQVVYWDSENCDSNYEVYENLLDRIVSEINEKEYLRSDIEMNISFRKDGKGRCRFEWEKDAGVKRYIYYCDIDRNKVEQRDCWTDRSFEFDGLNQPDMGYLMCSLQDADGNIYYHQLILLDEYGLYINVSDIVKPKGNTAANLNYTWNTIDGGKIGSANTDSQKMKLIVFAPMKTRWREIEHFYQEPLFRGKKYMDVVIVDTSQWSAANIKAKRTILEQDNSIKSGSSALTYCYDTSADGAKKAYENYCAQIGVTEPYDPDHYSCFLIDQKNQIIDCQVYDPYEDSMFVLVNRTVQKIEDKGYLTSGLAAPALQLKENKEGKIVLAWDAVPEAGGYIIYRADFRDENGNYGWMKVYEYPVDSYQHVTQYEDLGVFVDENGNNNTYYYKVAAKDEYGIIGGVSNVVTNEGLPTDVDPMRFKEIHLVDEDGNDLTSIDLHAGETKTIYLELERYNTDRVRIDRSDNTYWEIVSSPLEENNYYPPDTSREYADWWYQELSNQSRVNVTGVKPTDGAERFLYCRTLTTETSYGYGMDVYVPLFVTEAEEGITYPEPDQTLADCYTDRSELNAYVRQQMKDHASWIGFCVPEDIWDAWESETIWTYERDIFDFYEDREGMEPWEGDYLFYTLASFDSGGRGLITRSYKGKEYCVYTSDCSYWDEKGQEEKVAARMDELIWEPSGALYPYHNSPEYEIVKACMDWIQNNVSYIGTSDARYHSAYSALFNKKATCEGYSLLLYRMLREFGISNRILMGVDEGAHTYNIVESDGSYYYTDPSGNVLLKGENNFKHADWQYRFLDDEFTEKVASRISKTDYVYVPKYVRLLQVSGESETLTGNYSTFAQAAAEMKAGEAYRIVLLGNVSLSTGDELDLPETVTCEVNLNGYTLTVPSSSTGESHIRADLYGGDTKKGVIKTAKNQCLVLDPTSDRGMSVRNLTFGFDAASTAGGLNLKNTSVDQPLMFTNVTITGTPNVELGSNVIVDASSSFTVGTLKVSADSEQVVLNGKVTAKRFEYAAKDLFADNLTVSGETVVTDGGRLRVTGTATFAKVTVNEQVFYLDLIKTLDSDGNTAGTGTVAFTGALAKAADSDHAVEFSRWTMTDGSLSETPNPFMPEDSLATVTGTENVCPTAYFHIPEDSHGRELSLRREGNALKVKGIVVEVAREGGGQTRRYVSFDEAVSQLTADFGNEKGNYIFTFLSNAVMTKNLTLPAHVTGLRLESKQREEGQIFAQLDLKGFTLSMSAHVTLREGLQLLSIGKRGTLSLTGTNATFENPDFQVEMLSGEVTWVNAVGDVLEATPDSKTLLSNVALTASKGVVRLDGGTSDPEQSLRLGSISAKELYVNQGEWRIDTTTVASVYQIAEEAKAIHTNLSLTNSTARIDGYIVAENQVTMSNSRLIVGENGETEIDTVIVKSAFTKESAENGYTLENYGTMSIGNLQMPSTSGTFCNAGTALVNTVSSIRNFENKESACFISSRFQQVSGGRSLMAKDSVMVVHEKAVIYNAALCGAYFYQSEGCITSFEGKITRSAELAKEIPGLQYGVISSVTFENLKSNKGMQMPDGGEGLPAQSGPELQPVKSRTILFTTKTANFPTEYICVLQPYEDPEYTMVYQIGQNVRVGKKWIEIRARKVEGEDEDDEQLLESFLRWSDAVTYLSNLSNPNMVYIVDILDDLDMEQGLTLPARSAGIIFRGCGMPQSSDGYRSNILTYNGDLNLTTNVEFSDIILEAKNSKTGAEYESAVKLNGNTLTFSGESYAVFASVSGTAASSIQFDDNSLIEVHGPVNVGQLEGWGYLIGLATVNRDKNQNITAVNPQITLSGKMTDSRGGIDIGLQEKVVNNKVASYSYIDFSGETAAKIRADGIRLLKSDNANPDCFYFSWDNPGINGGTFTRKDGYLVWRTETDYAFELRYRLNEQNEYADEVVIPCRTFAEAVAEINRLKTRRYYEISIKSSEIQPAVLNMPNKNCISGLCITASEEFEESGPEYGPAAVLPYLGNLTLTTDTCLRNVGFQQMAKDPDGKYVPVDELKEDHPSPTTLSTGGYTLRIDGMVTFNTPLVLDGVNSGTLAVEKGGCLLTLTNGIDGDAFRSEDGSSIRNVIAGSVKRFKTFDLGKEQELILKPYTTVSSKGAESETISALQVTSMTLYGDVMIENGNATVRDLTLYGGYGGVNLTAKGKNAGQVLLTNVTLNGIWTRISADRVFTISGTLINRAESSSPGYGPELFTRQKPFVKGAAQMPYLNISGKVVSESENKIKIGVLPNDCTDDVCVELTDAPAPSGQLLTAKSAPVECFAVYGSGSYNLMNSAGYMLVKSGSNIYAYNEKQVAVALCRGEVTNHDLESETEKAKIEVINYYPGWQEAVAALNARNQAGETYTLLLLKDIGSREKPLSLAMPSKAKMVYVTGAEEYSHSEDGRQNLYYQKALTSGTNMVFSDVCMNPVTATGKGTALGFSIGNFSLVLNDVTIGDLSGMALKDITGKGKGSVTLSSDGITFTGGISGVTQLTVQKSANVKGAVKAATLTLENLGEKGTEFMTEGAVTVTDVVNKSNTCQNTLVYGRTAKNVTNLTVNGTIINEGGDSAFRLRLKMIIPGGKGLTEESYCLTGTPLKENGYQVKLTDAQKLAVMPKASAGDFVFYIGDSQVTGQDAVLVKAGKGLYLAGKETAPYHVTLEVTDSVDNKVKPITCLDLAQAVNEINVRADKDTGYTIRLGEDLTDTSLTDGNPYSALTLPGIGKAKEVVLSGRSSTGAADTKRPTLTFSGKLTAYGNVTMEYLTFNHVKGAKDRTPADFDIAVTGNSKNGGASLTLDQIGTTGDTKWNWTDQNMNSDEKDTGFINQISGTKNVTNVTIKNSKLRLKTGLTDVKDLSLVANAKLITCKNSAVNDLSMEYSSWDALGVTTIANITEFSGSSQDGSCYLAAKQAANTLLPQLTVNGKVTAAEKVLYKVIDVSAQTTKIKYVTSYRDVKLIRLPKEAAEKISLIWPENTGISESGGSAVNDIRYYKDTSNYVICGDQKDMVIRLTGTDSTGYSFADTYARSYQDAVTIINNLNDPKASYTLELLKTEILTGKNGAFGTMAFPANNKAASVTVKGSETQTTTLKFSGNLTAYGTVTLEDVTLQCVKKATDQTPTAFNFSINGAKDASLTLTNVKTSGGAWKDINGNNKATVILNSKGLVISGSITGVPGLTVQQNAEAAGTVKAATLTLENGVTFTTKGAVTVTDIVNRGSSANTLVYGRNAKNATNLTVNGSIINEGRGDKRLNLRMTVPENSDPKDYELTLTPLKNGGYKTTIGDAGKLAVMPKVSTQDFRLSIGGKLIQEDSLVKAEKGLYLLSDGDQSPLPYTVLLKLSPSDRGILCLDLAQAVKEINTLADGTADYTLQLNSVCSDVNITDNNAYSALTLPGSGKAASVTLKGGVNSTSTPPTSTPPTSTLTFSGNISMAGNLTMEDIVLDPVKSASNKAPADFNISVTGNAKTGAQLALNCVRTAADNEWNFTDNGMMMAQERNGFINQISGTKNVTDVTINDSSRLRLKTGLTSINNLTLSNTRLISCKSSAVNDLSMNLSSWDALGATTIANIRSFTGSDKNFYLASRQVIDKKTKALLPQLTISGKTEGDSVACKVITQDSTATDFRYVDSYDEVKLLKALKEDSERFTVAGRSEADGLISYKDTSGYVIRGNRKDMQVRISRKDDSDSPSLGTYAKCYLDAVTIIDNMNDPKASYILKLKDGEILTGKGGTVHGALTLPTKTAGIYISGSRDENDNLTTVIPYTGTLKPACPVYFDSVILTEGTINKKKEFVPSYQITLALGNRNVGFVNSRTLENPNAARETDIEKDIGKMIDLVCASVSASKGELLLEDEIMHVKGSFVVPKLQTAGRTAVLADKAMTLTDISAKEGSEEQIGSQLLLAPRFTAITKAGQQSVTQLSINGIVGDDVALTIAPFTYRLSSKSYDWMTAYEANAMLTTGEKPNAGQKLANLSKNTTLPSNMRVFYMDGEFHKDIPLSEDGEFRPLLSGNGLYIMRSKSASATQAN